METRRLRLYVVAYLRGLLKPYYENSIRSTLREELVIRALNDELDKDAMVNSLVADSTMALSYKNQTGLYDAIYDKVGNIRLLSEHAHKELTKNKGNKEKNKAEVKGKEKTLDIVEVYKILQETGLLDSIEELVPAVPK